MTNWRCQITDPSPGYVLLKIFETIIYTRSYNHINHNILVHEPFGFKNNSSTENSSYKLTDDILSSLNNKVWVGGIFCD